MNETDDRLLSKKEVCKLLTVSPATIDRWGNPEDPCYRPEFPRKRALGFRKVWSYREIQHFIHSVLNGDVT